LSFNEFWTLQFTAQHYFCCILISRFYYIQNWLHFNLADFPEVLIFYADKLMVMCNSKDSHVFNFAILLKSWKSDAREICMFYSNQPNESIPWEQKWNVYVKAFNS